MKEGKKGEEARVVRRTEMETVWETGYREIMRSSTSTCMLPNLELGPAWQPALHN